jgi:transposase
MADVNPKKRRRARLTVVHPHAAGIDIGSLFHANAVQSELDDEPVRKFTSFTKDLKLLAERLIPLRQERLASHCTDGADGKINFRPCSS